MRFDPHQTQRPFERFFRDHAELPTERPAPASEANEPNISGEAELVVIARRSAPTRRRYLDGAR